MNPGDIVLQPLALDVKSGCIALHEVMRFNRPHFAHCGVFVGDGQMITSSGKVCLQDAGASGNIAVPYSWNDWKQTEAFLRAQIGKPYDWLGWIIAALSPLVLGLNHLLTPTTAFTCSSLVGAALRIDGKTNLILGMRTVTPDDIARVIRTI